MKIEKELERITTQNVGVGDTQLQQPPKVDFSKYEGYLHAEVSEDGKHGILVDGPERDKDKLIDSIRDTWNSLPANSEEGLNPRGEFVADMSSIFKLATQSITRPSLDAVIDELSESDMSAYDVNPEQPILEHGDYAKMEGKFFSDPESGTMNSDTDSVQNSDQDDEFEDGQTQE